MLYLESGPKQKGWPRDIMTHSFIKTYKGPVGFGFDRITNEKTILYYLQKFSDDTLMENLLNRLTDEELEEIFNLLTRILKKHLTGSEYHQLFLKDDH